MLGAKSVIDALKQQKPTADSYYKLFKQSWLYRDLHKVRNIRPAFRYGLWLGIFYTAIEKI